MKNFKSLVLVIFEEEDDGYLQWMLPSREKNLFLNLSLYWTSILPLEDIRLRPIEFPILPLEPSLLNLFSMHHQRRNVHVVMHHRPTTRLKKIIGNTRHKTTHFIPRIRHQRMSIFLKFSEFQRLLLHTCTFQMKVDEIFHFYLSFIPLEDPFKESLLDTLPFMGPAV